MDADLKNRWVAALRSGDFKQGSGQLVKDNRYCCLGVLSAVANLKIDAQGMGVRDSITKEYNYNEIDRLLMNSGLDYFELWSMNDGGKMTFNQIADFIEENYRA